MVLVDIESHRIKSGGSLIASQWVLTAARDVFRVFNNDDLYSIKVILGEDDISTRKDSKIIRKEIKVEKIIPHEDYVGEKTTEENDIALLKLSEKVNLNIYTPICLPNVDDDFTGKTAWAYGKKSELSFV